ncbi:MAG: hypothetical protein Tsb0013_16200 [Phycisphaerales bacterium]
MNDEAPQQDDAKKKGGPPIKTVVVILALLVGEGAAIVFLMTMMGKPSEVAAQDLLEDPEQAQSVVVELPVLQDKFSNAKQGRLWIWDMEIVIAVETRHQEDVQAVLDRRASLIRSGIGRIIASAQHTYFQEPGYDTIRRQILDFLNGEELVGTDAEGEVMVQDVLIPSCIGFPADY